MSSLFAGGAETSPPVLSDDNDLASPLLSLGGGLGEYKHEAAMAMHKSTRPSTAETSALTGGVLFDPDYYHDYDDDRDYDSVGDLEVKDDRCCFRCHCRLLPSCLQFIKSLLAILLAMAGIASSALVCWDDIIFRDHDRRDVALAYSMAAISILVSAFVMWNEVGFLRGDYAAAARRKAMAILSLRRMGLREKNESLQRKADALEADAALYNVASTKLRIIAESQSFGVDDVVRMVKENEKNLDLIRENIRQKVMVDVVRIIIAEHQDFSDPRMIIDIVAANRISDKIKARIWKDHGVVLDERNFLHALASNSTIWGAVRTIKNFIPDPNHFAAAAAEDDVRDGLLGGVGDVDYDDAYEAFLLPIDDRRQAGAVDAARAGLAGATHTSLTPAAKRRRRVSSGRHRPTVEAGYDDRDSSSSLDTSGSPEKAVESTLRGQLRQFWAMSFPYFRESVGGRLLGGLLFVNCLCYSAISVYFSYLFRDFYTALAEKEAQTFYRVLYRFLISLIFLLPLQVSYGFIRVKLYCPPHLEHNVLREIAWRKWLTERVMKLYFANKVRYERSVPGDAKYALGSNLTLAKSAAGLARDYKDRRSEMDNPDQRIQEDIASFTSYSLSFFLTIVNTTIDLVSFSIILFTILPQLIIAIIVFASLGTLFTVLIGKVLIKLNYESLQREADFRFALVRIRENAESIAFYGGETLEERETKLRFDRTIDNKNMLNYAQMKLNIFTTTYYHLVNVLPIFILANEYFAGIIEFGVISQVRDAFWHILADFSVIIGQFNGIASFMASIDRLFLFVQKIQELDPSRPNEVASVLIAKESTTSPIDSDGIVLKEFGSSRPNYSSSQPILSISNLRLMTPDNKRVLIRNIDFSLSMGQNLLISGVSGAGKSSLLRAIAGLWKDGHGEITRIKDIYFLPQRPYCPPGTLRDQLLYPSTDENGTLANAGHCWSDDDLINILNSVDLPNLATRAGDGDPIRGINATLDWSNTLSLGEQQRLAFGRLLVNRPRFVMMDESTSALDVVAEKKMYMLLKEGLTSTTGDPITFVSVGHRPSIVAFHDIKLLLRDGSGYASYIPQEASSAIDQNAILSPMIR
ncbi:hypothetical protein ACHAW5_007336 [Stephanodiscus triporus]|uniref:ABC transporter n=1 Tax=Stephanodiscus triporus TaxID=2934178 RepID=A0ABD3MHI1_9STRA